MIISAMTIKLHAPWVHSLKEKRMVVQSIINKAKNKFNISIAEVDEMDIHQIIVIGIACVTNSTSHGDSVLNEVLRFIEGNTEAEVTDVEHETR
jgi:uncharacterized protein YlxP (DUF503 family)